MKKTAGISLMLLIFLSLCLITFSLLSLSGATADAKLAQNSAERTTEYYAAVTTANEILDEIDGELAAALQKAQTDENHAVSDDSEQTDESIPSSEVQDATSNSSETSGNRSESSSMAAYAEACGTISVSAAALTWEAADLNNDSSKETIISAASSANAADGDSETGDSTVVGTLQYDVAVTEDQLLHVTLSVMWPTSDSDTLYRITSWQIVSTADWSADTSQNLYRTGSSD